MVPLAIQAHHSEPTDPVLLRWLTDTVGEILGVGPGLSVVGILAVLATIPAVIVFFAVRQRRN